MQYFLQSFSRKMELFISVNFFKLAYSHEWRSSTPLYFPAENIQIIIQFLPPGLIIKANLVRWKSTKVDLN